MSVDLLERRLLFVTGKGGVGKSTIATALGVLAAQRGKRTLVCDLEARGDVADFLEAPRARFQPRQVQPGLSIMAMDTEASLHEYLRLQLRLPAIARIGPLARAFDFVATAAPGVREILEVGKVAYEARERHYDVVVVDAAATGHVVGQLGAPEAIDELLRMSPIRHQTSWLRDLLADEAATGVVVVTTPEEMPVNEAIDLIGRLRKETNVHVSAVVVNRVLPELFSRTDEEAFEWLRRPAVSGPLDEVAGGPVEPVLEAARLAVTMRRTRAEHLDHLRASVDADLPLLYVPYLFTRIHGRRTTAQVAEALSAELGY